MRWFLKFPAASICLIRSKACVAIIVTVFALVVLVNYTEHFGLHNHQTSQLTFGDVYRRMLTFSPESNFSVEVKRARSEIGCRRVKPGKVWASPKLALEHATPPQFLPQYKNPCWRSAEETGRQTLYCLPYFYIAGFSKSASTDLFRRISQHPMIIPGIKKEPMYLSRGNWSTCANRHKFVKERTKCCLKEYVSTYYTQAANTIRRNTLSAESTFCKTDENCNVVTSGLVNRFKNEWQELIAKESLKIKHPMVTVDSSDNYAADNHKWRELAENQGCPEPIVGPAHLITRMNSNVFAIFIVRDPTERLFSSFFHFKRHPTINSFHNKVKNSVETFKTCIGRNPFSVCLTKAEINLDVGIYHVHIARWLRLLPRSHVLVIETESYNRDIPGTLAQVYRFLKLPALSTDALEAISDMDKQGVGDYTSKVAGMLPETEKILREFYAEHNEMLAELLDDDRFAWRK